MEYPGTKFTRPIRRAMLFSFITTFLIVAPLTILYTEGYRYDWQNGKRKETGAISIDISPEDATVYVNGLKLRGGMPVELKRITPGSYSLHITAPGYYDWKKEVEVASKQTVYIKDIGMLKKNEPELVIAGAISNLFLSPNKQFLLFTSTSPTGTELWLRETATSSTEKILNTFDTDSAIAWSSGNRYALIESTKTGSKLLFDTENRSKPLDLEKAISSPVSQALWSGATNNLLFVQATSSIYTYNVERNELRLVSSERNFGWNREGDRLWTVTQNTTTKEWTIIKDAFGFPSVFGTVPSTLTESTSTLEKWRMADIVGGTVLFQNKTAGTVELVQANRAFTLSASHFFVSPFNNWVLLWNKSELWTYKDGEEPILLSRSGDDLNSVTPLDEYNTLALAWSSKTTALFPYYFIVHEIINQPMNSLAVDTDRRLMYFTRTTGEVSGLWQLSY